MNFGHFTSSTDYWLRANRGKWNTCATGWWRTMVSFYDDPETKCLCVEHGTYVVSIFLLKSFSTLAMVSCAFEYDGTHTVSAYILTMCALAAPYMMCAICHMTRAHWLHLKLTICSKVWLQRWCGIFALDAREHWDPIFKQVDEKTWRYYRYVKIYNIIKKYWHWAGENGIGNKNYDRIMMWENNQ
mgnify:CR=1 FL=1